MLLDRFRLDGKVAVVTGAGRGIGAGCALAFAEQGANVVVAARTKEQVEGTAEQARRLGVKALPVVCDVMERADLEALVAADDVASSAAPTSSSTTPAARRRWKRCTPARRCSTRRSAST